MFMLTMGAGMDFAIPDVCITPVPSPTGQVPTPLPYPNNAVTATSEPVAETILIDGMPALNLMSKGMVSLGDEAGVQGGVVSHVISGQALYIVGCETIMVDGAPAQRLTSVTGQNSAGELSNVPGMCIVPSQITVLAQG